MKNLTDTLKHKILEGQALTEQVASWKSDGKKIVFTNGCFDLLHAGHITYLAEAASLGDVLIVGLNSDSSVQMLKGPTRPVNDQHTRATVLGSMFFIDAVIPFSEETPLVLIKSIMPDVLVKGGDYEIPQIAGSKEVLENGGEVKILSFLPGYSSSAIIDKIKKG
jgi:rfaE bifunctional protein nucleotidyltransferase chain/domain